MSTAGFEQLRLDGVTRRFAGRDALTGLNLTIRRGEFIALLGPSGCGKSTALNCLAGLLPLTEGSIWQDATRLDTLPPERRGFGMVFQSYALFPHMTVWENVAFGLKYQDAGKQEIRSRVGQALELAQMQDLLPRLRGWGEALSRQVGGRAAGGAGIGGRG